MTIENAKKLIESELVAAAELFRDTAIVTDYCVEDTKNETDEGAETVDLFGVISLRTQGGDESGALFVPLNAELDSYGEVDEARLNESISGFRAKMEDYCKRLKEAPNVNEAMAELNREIDEELDRNYREQLARLDAATKKNLKIAIIATVALLAVAAVCFLIKGLF